MSVNRYQPHVLVLPEDDANAQIVNGFLLEPALQLARIQVLRPAGGWEHVLDRVRLEHAQGLRRYANRRLVLLIDFDDQIQTRAAHFASDLPPDVCNRIFLLGSQREPEHLRTVCGLSFESIGRYLARDCAEQKASGLWQHEQLSHNAEELTRLMADVRPFLFHR